MLDEHRFATRFEEKKVTTTTWPKALRDAVRKIKGRDRIQQVEALYLLLEIADLRPRGCDLAKVWLNAGSIYLLFNHLEEAVKAYQQSLHVDPTSWKARFNMGVALARQRVFAIAVVELTRALDECPFDVAKQIRTLLEAIETIQTRRNERAFQATNEARAFTVRYLETLHLLASQPQKPVPMIYDDAPRYVTLASAPLLLDTKQTQTQAAINARHALSARQPQPLVVKCGILDASKRVEAQPSCAHILSIAAEQAIVRSVLETVDELVEAVVSRIRREQYVQITPNSLEETPIRTENRYRLD